MQSQATVNEVISLLIENESLLLLGTGAQSGDKVAHSSSGGSSSNPSLPVPSRLAVSTCRSSRGVVSPLISSPFLVLPSHSPDRTMDLTEGVYRRLKQRTILLPSPPCSFQLLCSGPTVAFVCDHRQFRPFSRSFHFFFSCRELLD